MKRLFGLFMSLALLMAFCFPAAAIPSADPSLKIYDFADLLTSAEESELASEISGLITKYNIDIAVVTTNDSEGKSPVAYADDFYDQNGFGPDGLLLLINLRDRDVYISTCGDMINKFSDDALDGVISYITPDLSNGNYARACLKFLSATDRHLTSYAPASPLEKLGISAMFGILGALIIVAVMLFRHKSSLATAPGSRSYIVKDGVNITGREDRFLNTFTSRTPIPRDNNRGGGSGGGGSRHISSGGVSHGGRGGKF